MVSNPGTTAGLVSGDFLNTIGYFPEGATRTPCQVNCTEAASFTGLGFFVMSGGSGTNTLTFEDAGVSGQQVASVAGTGVAEDTTNTDSLTAGDLFDLAYTDTGTNSAVSWIKQNVEFGSGYGAFHGSGAFTGVVFDVASTTRYIPLSGTLVADGAAVEANVGFKARGYTTFEALQVSVSANARTNNSVFRNRIASANGTGAITYASAETGLKTATGLADAIADGAIVNASVALDTGVEDLTVEHVTSTLKSSDTQQDIWGSSQAGLVRTANATAHYFTLGGPLFSISAFTEAQARCKPGFAGTVSNLRCYLSANTYSADGTLKLYQNGVAVITTTITASGGAAWYENTSDSITIDADDELSYEIDEGTTGSITVQMVGVTIAPTVVSATSGHRVTGGGSFGRIIG